MRDNVKTIKNRLLQAGWTIVKKIAYQNSIIENDLIFHRTGKE